MIRSIGTPTRELVTGNHAYVIVPSVYSFKLKGVAMSETAQSCPIRRWRFLCAVRARIFTFR
jgi:hypothetical protein